MSDGGSMASRRSFLKTAAAGAAGMAFLAGKSTFGAPAFIRQAAASKPNILLILSDDNSFPLYHIHGDPLIKTDNIDRIGREGIVFNNVYCTTSSCTPARAELLSGEKPWSMSNLRDNGTVDGPICLDNGIPGDRDTQLYQKALMNSGYSVGFSGKGFGPPSASSPTNAAGGGVSANYYSRGELEGFEDFVKTGRDKSKPFSFWLGSRLGHRSFSGADELNGHKQDSAVVRSIVPAFMPDVDTVRKDLLGFYSKLQEFDSLVGGAVKLLEDNGLLDNTIIIVTADDGMPFPRAKAQCYEYSCHVPMVAMWKAAGNGGRTVDDFIAFDSFAPTFYEAASLAPHARFTGKSFLDIFSSNKSGFVDASRDHVIMGFEKHGLDFPMRAIRTKDHFYIRNLHTDWDPVKDFNSSPAQSGDQNVDGGGASYEFMLAEYQKGNSPHKSIVDLTFAHRPAEELYLVSGANPDYANVKNVAAQNESACHALWTQLKYELEETKDIPAYKSYPSRPDAFDAAGPRAGTVSTLASRRRESFPVEISTQNTRSVFSLGNSGHSTISVCDASGREVWRHETNAAAAVWDHGTAPYGRYIVKISRGGRTVTKMLNVHR